MPLKVNLPLASAEIIITEALRAGREEGMMPLTVVVLDSGGHVIAMKREDGSGIMRNEIAIGKAHGALGMGMSSHAIRDRLADRPAFQAALAAASGGKFVPVPGGVLINDAEGDTIGAVGVSGDTSDKDEYCATQGVKAANLYPNPPAPSHNWRSSSLGASGPSHFTFDASQFDSEDDLD